MKLRYKAWRLESAATIEEVSRKMRDTASETLALPHEEAASSITKHLIADLWDKGPCLKMRLLPPPNIQSPISIPIRVHARSFAVKNFKSVGAAGRVALPGEEAKAEATSSLSSTSMFDVGRSMFDVRLLLSPQ